MELFSYVTTQRLLDFALLEVAHYINTIFKG